MNFFACHQRATTPKCTTHRGQGQGGRDWQRKKPIVCGLVRWLVKESLMSHRKDISSKNPVAVGPPEGSSLSSVRIYDHLSPRTQAVLFLAKRVCPFHVTRISCQIWNSIPYSIKLLKRSPFCKRIKELLLNFLRSEDDYVEVPRLIMLVSLCNCYYSLCFMLVFFLFIVL